MAPPRPASGQGRGQRGCTRGESNPYALRRRNLNPVRMPISPLVHCDSKAPQHSPPAPHFKPIPRGAFSQAFPGGTADRGGRAAARARQPLRAGVGRRGAERPPFWFVARASSCRRPLWRNRPWQCRSHYSPGGAVFPEHAEGLSTVAISVSLAFSPCKPGRPGQRSNGPLSTKSAPESTRAGRFEREKAYQRTTPDDWLPSGRNRHSDTANDSLRRSSRDHGQRLEITT